jgi:hypothetical protein
LGGKRRKLRELGAIYQETQPCEDQWANVCRTPSFPPVLEPLGLDVKTEPKSLSAAPHSSLPGPVFLRGAHPREGGQTAELGSLVKPKSKDRQAEQKVESGAPVKLQIENVQKRRKLESRLPVGQQISNALDSDKLGLGPPIKQERESLRGAQKLEPHSSVKQQSDGPHGGAPKPEGEGVQDPTVTAAGFPSTPAKEPEGRFPATQVARRTPQEEKPLAVPQAVSEKVEDAEPIHPTGWDFNVAGKLTLAQSKFQDKKPPVLPRSASRKAEKAKPGQAGSSGEFDDAACSECGSRDDGERMLLCDGPGCPGAAHIYCLVPPLGDVPPGDWFCSECQEVSALFFELVW